jgi:hypothetical protein
MMSLFRERGLLRHPHVHFEVTSANEKHPSTWGAQNNAANCTGTGKRLCYPQYLTNRKRVLVKRICCLEMSRQNGANLTAILTAI